MIKQTNLWREFRKDCPFLSAIPIFRSWAFGVYARGYFEAKERWSHV